VPRDLKLALNATPGAGVIILASAPWKVARLAPLEGGMRSQVPQMPPLVLLVIQESGATSQQQLPSLCALIAALARGARRWLLLMSVVALRAAGVSGVPRWERISKVFAATVQVDDGVLP